MSISVEDLRHRFMEFQVDGCVDVGAFHDLVRNCYLGESALSDGLITTLFKLLDVSRRGIINWTEFERLPSLLMSIALKPSHPGDPLPPSGTAEIPPVAISVRSTARPVRLILPTVEEGWLNKGSAWARLGLDVEDDIHLATRSIGRSRSRARKDPQRFGKFEDILDCRANATRPEVSPVVAPIASSAPPSEPRPALLGSPSPIARVASVEECVASWLNKGEPPLL